MSQTSREALTMRILLLALLTSKVVESLKSHHAPWLENFPNTTNGYLVLGNAFSRGDLVDYTMGAVLGGLGEWLVQECCNNRLFLKSVVRPVFHLSETFSLAPAIDDHIVADFSEQLFC